MLILHQTPPAWGIPNISPFCTKLETYLRMAEIPYRVEPGDPRKAPTNKIPYVNLNGQLIGDSQLIIEALKKKFGDKVDGHLTKQEWARGHLVRRTLEEGTYYVILHTRWAESAAWAGYQATFKSMFPPLLGNFIVPMIRKKTLNNLWAQGTGRHPGPTIYEIGKADLDAVATELGDKPFLLGDKPSSFDAAVFGFTSGIAAFPSDSPIKSHLAALANLAAYNQRMLQRYFPADRPPGGSK